MLLTVCKRWWVLLLRGIAAVALGICAIVWPALTITTLILCFGIFSIIDGIGAIVLGFRGEADGTVWWTMVILGLLATAAGVVVLAWPALGLAALVTIVAISALLRGAFEIYAAIVLRKEIDDEWILGLSGALSALFGVLILYHPTAGVLAITLLIGAYMIAVGAFAIALALRLKMLGQKWAN
jgi:uncharacterized membrane protein HdeD (DUF308 family)